MSVEAFARTRDNKMLSVEGRQRIRWALRRQVPAMFATHLKVVV